MNIEIQNDELQFVRPILLRVAKRYRELMIHREVISGKLRELRVFVRWKCDDDREDGFYRLEHDPDRISHYIELHIDPRDGERGIAFVFAHELSHMLLGGSGDYVSRMTEAGGIPRCLEESMADNLAYYLISRCRFENSGIGIVLRMIEDGYCTEFADCLAKGFGAPLCEAKHIDEFLFALVDTKERELEEEPRDDAAFWRAYFGREMEDGLAELHVHNHFWYLSVLGKFSTIPEIFDEYMGEGAFDSVCDDVSFYHYTVRNGVDADIVERALNPEGPIFDEAEQAKQRAFDLLQRFADIRTKEREEAS